MSLIKDLETLTTIPEKTVNEFFKKIVYCICNDIQEEIIEKNPEILTADLGFGILYIKKTSEGLKYKFSPGEYFKKNIEATMKQKQNPLKNNLNKTLIKKFIETYKNLC